MDTAEKAALLRSLHHTPPLLVLPNAWDVGSARVLAALPGCRALATTSAGVAKSLGFEDGEQAPAEEMIRAAGRIAAAVELPVTGDLERGYGDPVGTARAAWAAGLSGMNFEDSTAGAMVAADEQAHVIRDLRAAVRGLVLNARIDVFLRGADDIDEAVERGNAYLAAGAQRRRRRHRRGGRAAYLCDRAVDGADRSGGWRRLEITGGARQGLQ